MMPAQKFACEFLGEWIEDGDGFFKGYTQCIDGGFKDLPPTHAGID